MKTHQILLIALALLAATGCDKLSPFIDDEMFAHRNDLDDDGVSNEDDCAPLDPKITKFDFWRDLDHDGVGSGEPVKACAKSEGFVDKSGDCNDGNDKSFPGNTEVCDLIDNDCNGKTDEGFVNRWYRDQDNDQHGDPASSKLDCGQPVGYVTNSDDCKPEDSTIHPGAIEICDDKIDQDCNGKTDDALTATLWFADVDGDNAGDPAVSFYSCKVQEGYVINDDDCNDSSPNVGPAVPEACGDLVDNDCDEITDTDAVDTAWFADSDGDGFGNPEIAQTACAPPIGFVGNNLDCNDKSDKVKPGIAEVCNNGIDDNCDDSPNQCQWKQSVSVDEATITFLGDFATGTFGKICTPTKNLTAVGQSGLAISSPLLSTPSTQTVGQVAIFNTPFASSGSAVITTTQANAIILGKNKEDRIGAAIIAETDFTNDGLSEIVIGMPLSSFCGFEGGGVVVKQGPISSTNILEGIATICPMNKGDNTGAVLKVLEGKFGAPELLIGSPGYDNGSYENSGLISRFTTLSDTDISKATTVLIGESANDYAGSVLETCRINDDNLPDLIVGVPSATTNTGQDSGKVYVFLSPLPEGTHNLSEAHIILSGLTTDENAGSSLACLKGWGKNGTDALAVGARNGTGQEPKSGKVYIFLNLSEKIASSMSDAETIFLGEHQNDQSGTSLAWIGDQDGDGFSEFLIGAPSATGDKPNCGVAYLISGPLPMGQSLLGSSNIRFSGQKTNDQFGTHLAGVWDLNKDGRMDFTISATHSDLGGEDAGAVFFFRGLGL